MTRIETFQETCHFEMWTVSAYSLASSGVMPSEGTLMKNISNMYRTGMCKLIMYPMDEYHRNLFDNEICTDVTQQIWKKFAH